MKYSILLFLIYLFVNKPSFSQSIIQIDSSVVSLHYSNNQLLDLQQNNPEKYNSIFYYYLNSFIVEELTCNNCDNSIDLKMIDISNYEIFRLKSKRYEREFQKFGFKLILLSIDELEYKLPIHN